MQAAGYTPRDPNTEPFSIMSHSSSQTSSRDGYWFDTSMTTSPWCVMARQVELARFQPPWLVVDQTIAA